MQIDNLDQEQKTRISHIRQSKKIFSFGNGLIFLMAVLIICIPKMGFYIAGGVPLYASVVMGEILALIGFMSAIRYSRETLSQVFLLLMGFVTILWTGHFCVVLTQQASALQIARIVFYFLPFTGLGIIFFIVHRPNRLVYAVDCTRLSFYFLLFYAFLQLVFGAEAVAIQNITANYESSFEDIIKKTNVIHRLGGDTFKLFGTYQNGNLFAISLILLAPIAIYSEKRVWVSFIAIALLHVVIVFCASTTSYISIIMMDAIFIFSLSVLRKYALVFVGGILIVWVVFFSSVCSKGQCDVFQLLEAKLINRDITINERWNKTAIWMDNIGDNPFILFFGEMSTSTVQIFEVLPISILQFYGISVTFIFYAFIIYALKPLRFRLYKVGVIIYLITSIGSGGFWLTPTTYILGIVCGIIVGLDRYEARLLKANSKVNEFLPPTSHIT